MKINLHHNSFTITRVILALSAVILLLSMLGCDSFINGEGNDNINTPIGGTDKCYDLDGDHKCDVCKTVLNVCIDITDPKDHLCDVCGAGLTKCPIDDIRDHKCDICGVRFSECYDADNSHVCDYCGLPIIDCVDVNKDHKCDFCNLELTKCVDSDKNHMCDICKKRLNRCNDSDPIDHICDLCGKQSSSCSDPNRDHICDLCLAVMSTCGDEDKNHLCDICEIRLSECIDEMKNHICDICGCKLPMIIITIAENCLINGKTTEELYTIGFIPAIFSYSGDGNQPVGWIMYDADNNEVLRINDGDLIQMNVAGSYHIVPVFD